MGQVVGGGPGAEGADPDRHASKVLDPKIPIKVEFGTHGGMPGGDGKPFGIRGARDLEGQIAKQNLRRIGLALQNFVAANQEGRLPPWTSGFVKGKPCLSWRVALLPHLEEPGAKELYAEFHQD